ncbi:hypothetical protein FHS18_006891 [Paenibacillus phyllosphaerae]|uniref:Uncharacterized protein n=1 Tax=Paenibacillus phyllosphaerae TaxID=274593 RepID=A0A7W5FRU3_9BACL|nr:hypothetical protein [Paenibacillus phyllosphaerae]MBB3114733.1 hypothetical protein [Paenibacillus phyllosphaerae]
MKTLNTFILLFIITVAITSCAKNEEANITQEASNAGQRSDILEKIHEIDAHSVKDVVTSKNLNELIEKSFEKYYGLKAENYKIEKNEEIDNGIFTLFTLVYNDKDYVGYLYSTHNSNSNKYNTVYLDIYPEDTTSPFSIVQSAGEFDELHRKYQMVLGFINDKNIKRIVVRYSDDTTNILDLSNENKSFMDVTLGEIKKANLVTAYNENNEKVFEYIF